MRARGYGREGKSSGERFIVEIARGHEFEVEWVSLRSMGRQFRGARPSSRVRLQKGCNHKIVLFSHHRKELF